MNSERILIIVAVGVFVDLSSTVTVPNLRTAIYLGFSTDHSFIVLQRVPRFQRRHTGETKTTFGKKRV